MSRASADLVVREGVGMRHHQRGFLWFFGLAWGWTLIVCLGLAGAGFAFAVSHTAGSKPTLGLVIGIVALALGLATALYMYRVLTATVTITGQAVVVRNIRRTVRIPRGETVHFQRCGMMVVPVAPSGSPPFAGIALATGAAKPIKLVAFEKWPNTDHVRRNDRCTYFDATITELNRALTGPPGA